MENFKKYYSGKNMIRRYILISFILLIIILQFVRPRGVDNKTNFIGSNQVPNQNFSSLNFAGEQVPMDGKYIFNQERFDREFLLTRLNDAQFILTHKRQGLYGDYISSKFKKYNIPQDLQYLPMIESYLKETVVSSVGAAGIRQFMPGTAIKYGLTVNEFVDQRFDPFLSTDAVILYLKDLYAIFNNRTLVLAAYNRGEYGLQSDMQNQFQSGYYDLYLNNETYRFVFRVLAMKYLMENKYSYFDSSLLGNQYVLPSTKLISVGTIEDLKIWCKDNGYSYLEIKQLNPWIRKNSLPEGNRKIKVFKN
ncbi:MAG: transglycosylase SLT domain-containing protein [Candidatus Absconditicoccaceae bacterium]